MEGHWAKDSLKGWFDLRQSQDHSVELDFLSGKLQESDQEINRIRSLFSQISKQNAKQQQKYISQLIS